MSDEPSGDVDFASQLLQATNFHRRIVSFAFYLARIFFNFCLQHDAPPLVISDDLAKRAQQWALKCARERHVSYAENPGKFATFFEAFRSICLAIGECMTIFPSTITPLEVVEHWYGEEKHYNYDAARWQLGTNYFTQLVWRGTRKVCKRRFCLQFLLGLQLGVGRAPLADALQPANRHPKTGLPIAHSLENCQIVVALFSPAGNDNRDGQFALNVAQPIAAADYAALSDQNEGVANVP